MKRFCTSDSSCGIIIFAIAILLSVLFPKFYVITLALVGLTHGLSTRNLRLGAFGFMSSVILINVLDFLHGRIYYQHTYVYFPSRFPYYLDSILSGAMILWGALLGAAITLYRERLVLVGAISSFASVSIVSCIGAALAASLPVEDVGEIGFPKWVCFTLLFSVPITGFGMWWPVEVIRSKTRRTS